MPATLTGDLQTLLTEAAFAPIPDRAFLRISGPDAPRWLNGMVTNAAQALGPGEGNYNFLLNAQGRIQGDGTVYREPGAGEPVYVLETDKAQVDTLQQLLDRFIIMDDVELSSGLSLRDARTEPSPFGVRLFGPLASTLVPKLVTARRELVPLDPPPPGTMTFGRFAEQDVVLFAPPAPSLRRFEIWCEDRSTVQELYRVLDSHSVPLASDETQEQLRILEARPRYGTDIRNTETARDLPQETAQTHALYFAKGCYLGQEIVERIRSRGQVHRQFTAFRLEGAPPPNVPAPLEANGKPAGELTSAVPVLTTEGPVWLAVGYARREFLETRTPLTYPGGIAHPRPPGDLA